MVIYTCCKGTTLDILNTIQAYYELLVLVLDSINHYNTTTLTIGWVMKGYVGYACLEIDGII